MVKIRQPSANELETLEYDFFITASGYESRAITQAEKYAKLSHNKIALGFNSEMDDQTRKCNDKFFLKSGFSISIINGEESTNSILNNLFCDIEKFMIAEDHAIVYIDYSCMTRNWYSLILPFLQPPELFSKIDDYDDVVVAKVFITGNNSERSGELFWL